MVSSGLDIVVESKKTAWTEETGDGFFCIADLGPDTDRIFGLYSKPVAFGCSVRWLGFVV